MVIQLHSHAPPLRLPPPLLSDSPSRTDFSIKIQTFKAHLLLFSTFSSLHQNSSPSAAASSVNICSESGGFIEINASFGGLAASCWIEYHLLRIPETPPVMFSPVRRNQDALHFSVGWGGLAWYPHFKVSSHTHSLRLSGLKCAASTELKPSHGGSSVSPVASQEQGPGLKPEPQSLHVLSVSAWTSSHSPEACR